MTHPYDIPSITINNRDVEVRDILSGSAAGDTEFEIATFQFIKEWLLQHELFTMNTSGSTGDAKPITIIRSQMQHSAKLTLAALGLKRNDVALVCINTGYIAGKMMLVRALEAGMKIVATEPSSNPVKHVRSKIHFAALVPLQLQTVLTSGREYSTLLSGMKAIIVGGATISDELRRRTRQIDSPVYATYGMTETISHVGLQRLNGDDPDPCFNVLPGISIHLDERKCLVIGASYLPTEVITNDLVTIVGPGKFQWLGRVDNIINTGGIKVMPEKIEQVIGKIFYHHGIRQNFFVGGVPDNNLGFKIILIVEGQKSFEKDDVLEGLHQTFSKYEIPKEIRWIPHFIYTETGKVNRKKTLKLA